jgi:acyl-CoA reductase-like NAD-dependent aldehyde dehydrogenase
VPLAPAAAELARRASALAGDRAGAAPQTLAGVVLAGNIPGLAVQSLLPALLLGRPLLLKSASAEPWFAPALVAALAAREPALGDAYAAVGFVGDDAAAMAAAFGEVDPLLAYGGAKPSPA